MRIQSIRSEMEGALEFAKSHSNSLTSSKSESSAHHDQFSYYLLKVENTSV